MPKKDVHFVPRDEGVGRSTERRANREFVAP
jgi:hypothetical protein